MASNTNKMNGLFFSVHNYKDMGHQLADYTVIKKTKLLS